MEDTPKKECEQCGEEYSAEADQCPICEGDSPAGEDEQNRWKHKATLSVLYALFLIPVLFVFYRASLFGKILLIPSLIVYIIIASLSGIAVQYKHWIIKSFGWTGLGLCLFIALDLGYGLIVVEPYVDKMQTSPDGTWSVKTEITEGEAGVKEPYIVRLIFKHNNKEITHRRLSRASDVMKWAIKWHDSNTLVLYSSDIGIYSYDVQESGVTKRVSSKDEKKTGRDAYRERYGSEASTWSQD